MSDRVAGRIDPDTIRGKLADANPVVKYGVATLVVFGPLYIAQSYGIRLAWPVALVIGLYFVVMKRDLWEQWL
jgi:hypothetical protein